MTPSTRTFTPLRSTEHSRRRTAEAMGMTPEKLDALAADLDALRDRLLGDLGQTDVDYIRKLIRIQRSLEVAGRAALFASFLPPFWLFGATALSLSKILDNMEIGHNVMHGQYDWTHDPTLSSSGFEWDTACPGDQWRHSHNYLHHTFTNIVGKDRDLGYGILRMTESEPWKKGAIGNPLYALALMLTFEHGVMFHDVEIERVWSKEKTWADAWPTLRDGLRKSGKLAVKDYLLWPALTGPSFVPTLLANATANLVRNVWAFSVIFCGHFPAGVFEFTEEECEGESKGHWYFRQMLGSANITGGKLMHILTGNLSFQIEHHLFPDIPARRYQQIAPEVRAICEKYGLPYNSGGMVKQLATVARRIVSMARKPRRSPASAPVPTPGASETQELALSA